MKKIILQDEDKAKAKEIVLRDTANIDEVFYVIYKFNKGRGWFDFSWEVINEMERARLLELLPDLQHFQYGGKVYVREVSQYCHLYTMELGSNSITVANKIIQKFYNIVNQSQFNDDTDLDELDKLLENINSAQTELHNAEKEFLYVNKFEDADKFEKLQNKITDLKTEIIELLKKKQALRNPHWVPGISSPSLSERIKFAIFKQDSNRSICNMIDAKCENGIPDKVKKMLMKEIEKNPEFKYILKMFLVFDYVNSFDNILSQISR